MIKKPDTVEEFGNLENWVVVIAYDDFHENWLTTSVVEMMEEDRFLMAWYALWRKWPLFYPVWEWAARFKEVRDPLMMPNYCKYFKTKYEAAILSGDCNLIPKENFYTWVGHHMCAWDHPRRYHYDPAVPISRQYPEPKSDKDMTDEEKEYWNKLFSEWKETQNLPF